MKIEEFKDIAETKLWKANRDKNNVFYNKNKTLWEYEGDGVKIGYTKEREGVWYQALQELVLN